ncbi:unnamed protein product [Victoria cruziana]
MSCVARRTRSQTQRSSSSHPPGEGLDGEEGRQSGSVGGSLGRQKDLGSARKRRRIARRNGWKSETVVLSSEEEGNNEEGEEEEEEGHQGSFVGKKWNLRSQKGREEAYVRGFCWVEIAGLTLVRENVPSCYGSKRGVTHVTGDHEGCKEKKLVGGKGISRRMLVETNGSEVRKFHWSNEFVGAKTNVTATKTRQRERLTKHHSWNDSVNASNDDNKNQGTDARRRNIAVKEEMRSSLDANMGHEDEKVGVDDHVVSNDEEEKQEGIEEEIGREKRRGLQRENKIIQKKEIKGCMEREKHGASAAMRYRFNGQRTDAPRAKRSLRCPLSVSNYVAQSDAGDHFKKKEIASDEEAKAAQDCTDDPSDANDEDIDCRLLNNCIVRRTRSKFKTPIGKIGTFSKPTYIDRDNSPHPSVGDYDMHHDGSGSSHQLSEYGVSDHDDNDHVAGKKGLPNDFAELSSQRINGDIGTGAGFADEVMETAELKITGNRGTCFDDFIGDAGRLTDGFVEKGMREMARKLTREQLCEYIDDDSSSSSGDSEDEEDESDEGPDIEINKHPAGDFENGKTNNLSPDKKVAIPYDVESNEGGNLTNELPLWFSWTDVEPEHVKSETEEKMDALWTELDFVLGCEAIGSFDWKEIEVEPKGSLLGCESKSPACQHQFILDEQVGVICTLCSFVETEIKYYMPQCGTLGKQRRKGSYEEEDDSVLDEFDCEELSGCSDASNNLTSGTVWDIIPELRKKMFQHQKEGFEFIWRNLAGGIVLDKLNSNSDVVGGCLISHAPGSGKTFLTIAFLQSFFQRFDDCRPMIVAPVNLLHICEGEFRKWGIGVPLHVLNSRGFFGKESSSALELLRRRQGKSHSIGRQNLFPIIKIFSWIDRKSVMLLSYGLFRKLTMEGQDSDKEGHAMRKILLEYPGLLVLDEGHTARNKFSRIWQCLKCVKTQRRIMLSGTPFQNNFLELFNTLYLIRPRFAEGISKRFGSQEGGLEADPFKGGTSLQDKNERMFRRTFAAFLGGIEPQGSSSRLKELRLIIDPFVHVHEGNLHKLPGLRDYFVFLYPSTLQRCVLERLSEKSNFDNNYRADLSNARITDGVKVRFVVDLVRLYVALGEKVLVFSQFAVKVLLVSTEVCAEGMDLTGSSRVVLLDLAWNPSVRKQNIGRAYRFGQKKVVYVYNLIASSTLEEKKHKIQDTKDRFLQLMFSTVAKNDMLVDTLNECDDSLM